MSSRQRVVSAVVAAAVLVGSARRARTREVSDAEEGAFRIFNDAPNFIHAPVWAVMQAGSLAAVGVVAAGLVRRGRPREATAAAISGTLVLLAAINSIAPLGPTSSIFLQVLRTNKRAISISEKLRAISSRMD